MSSLPVIALITVPCNVQVLKAAAFACVARPLRDSRKNVSDVLYIQFSKCFENFFTSHLYSRKFQVLITKTSTFSTFYTKRICCIFSRKNTWDISPLTITWQKTEYFIRIFLKIFSKNQSLCNCTTINTLWGVLTVVLTIFTDFQK